MLFSFKGELSLGLNPILEISVVEEVLNIQRLQKVAITYKVLCPLLDHWNHVFLKFPLLQKCISLGSRVLGTIIQLRYLW